MVSPSPSCIPSPSQRPRRSSLLVRRISELHSPAERQSIVISGPRRLGSVHRRGSMVSTSSTHRISSLLSINSSPTATSKGVYHNMHGEGGSDPGVATQTARGGLPFLRVNSLPLFSTASSIATLRPKSILKSSSSAPAEVTTTCTVVEFAEARDGALAAPDGHDDQDAGAGPGQVKSGRGPLSFKSWPWLTDRFNVRRNGRGKPGSSAQDELPGQMPAGQDMMIPASHVTPTRPAEGRDGGVHASMPRQDGRKGESSPIGAVRFSERPCAEEAICLDDARASHKRGEGKPSVLQHNPTSCSSGIPTSTSLVHRRRPGTPVSAPNASKSAKRRSLHSAVSAATRVPQPVALKFAPLTNENAYNPKEPPRSGFHIYTASNSSSLEPVVMPVPLRSIDRNVSPTTRASSSKPRKMNVEEFKARTVRANVEKAFRAVSLPAKDLDLSVSFFESQHFEIWDMRDDICVAWPAELRLRPKDAARWDNTPLVTPDIARIEVVCSTKAYCDLAHLSHPYSLSDADSAYCVSYTGAICLDGCTSTMKPERGIHLGGDWERTYWGRAPHSLHGNNGVVGRTGRAELPLARNDRGWSRKIWIPIPTRLFVKRETRLFDIEARIWIGDDDDDVPLMIRLGDHGLAGDVLHARAEMTVSHLRSERLMR